MTVVTCNGRMDQSFLCHWIIDFAHYLGNLDQSQLQYPDQVSNSYGTLQIDHHPTQLSPTSQPISISNSSPMPSCTRNPMNTDAKEGRRYLIMELAALSGA